MHRDGAHAADIRGDGLRVRLELDVVAGEIHECFLERCLLRRQLVQGDPVLGGGVADLRRGQAGDFEQAGLERLDADVRAGGEARPEIVGLRRAHAHDVAGGVPQEVLDARVGDEPAATDDDQVVGRQRHLAHQVRGDEDGSALGGEAFQEVADPVDAFGVETVDRLVEHHGVRIAEERGGDAEPLPHAEREGPDALRRDLAQSDEVDQLVDPAARDAVRLRQGEQVVVGGAPGVDGPRLEQRADFVQRCRMVAVELPVDGDGAGRRRIEPEDEAHRGRLARSVRAEEAGDDSRLDGEAEPVDGALRAVVLRQVVGLDHLRTFKRHAWGFV